MKMQIRRYLILVCFVLVLNIPSFAQTPERRQTNPKPEAQEQPATLPPNATSIDVVANEIGLLRKSLQTLNVRLREISNILLSPDTNQSKSASDKQNRISLNLDLLTRTEQRAELMRKELFELIEKETALKSRLMQIDEDMRPESIERAMNLVGTTRPAELRDARRRVLENDRRGIESLLNQTSQSRQRLEDDVRQADALVSKLRQRILPLIDSEIEKINPN